MVHPFDASGAPGGGDGPSGGEGGGGGEPSGAPGPSDPNGPNPPQIAPTPGGGGGATPAPFQLPPLNPDQFGPWSVNQTLSPNQQTLLTGQEQLGIGRQNIAQGMLPQIAQTLSQPLNTAGMAPGFDRISGPNYDTSARNRAESALYGRQTQYLDPQFQQGRDQLEQKLLAEGWNRNDPAFRQQMDNFDLQKQRAYSDARDSAIVGGGQEASGELARALSSAQFGQSERDKALQDAYQRIGLSVGDRSRGLSELGQLSSGAGPTLPGMPATAGGGQPGGLDILGTAQQGYANQLGGYNASQASNASMTNGLLGTLGSLLGAYMMYGSDRRLKHDAVHVLTDRKGHKWYEFKWANGAPGFGVMADEVPAAYRVMGTDGYWRVNYGALNG